MLFVASVALSPPSRRRRTGSATGSAGFQRGRQQPHLGQRDWALSDGQRPWLHFPALGTSRICVREHRRVLSRDGRRQTALPGRPLARRAPRWSSWSGGGSTPPQLMARSARAPIPEPIVARPRQNSSQPGGAPSGPPWHEPTPAQIADVADMLAEFAETPRKAPVAPPPPPNHRVADRHPLSVAHRARARASVRPRAQLPPPRFQALAPPPASPTSSLRPQPPGPQLEAPSHDDDEDEDGRRLH